MLNTRTDLHGDINKVNTQTTVRLKDVTVWDFSALVGTLVTSGIAGVHTVNQQKPPTSAMLLFADFILVPPKLRLATELSIKS